MRTLPTSPHQNTFRIGNKTHQAPSLDAWLDHSYKSIVISSATISNVDSCIDYILGYAVNCSFYFHDLERFGFGENLTVDAFDGKSVTFSAYSANSTIDGEELKYGAQIVCPVEDLSWIHILS
jgi:hypothetical protein